MLIGRLYRVGARFPLHSLPTRPGWAKSSYCARRINLAYAAVGNGAPYSRSKLASVILARSFLRAATNGAAISCRPPSNLNTECSGDKALRLWSGQRFILRMACDDSALA